MHIGKIVFILLFLLVGSFSKAQEFSIVGVGDMMLGTDFPNSSYVPISPENILQDVAPIIQKADVAFGNVEGVIAESTVPITKRCQDPSKCYAFRMPPKMATFFKQAGFDFVSLANNHSGDCGNKGRERTAFHLQNQKIGISGLIDFPSTSFLVDSTKFCLIAFSPNFGTLSINDIPNAKKRVAKLNKECTIIIVSFHGGAEGEKYQHVANKTEHFYGENRGNVVAFSHAMIDAGADIIFGHGPHVTRAIEIYKSKFIAYSLGNFATYGRFNLKGAKGMSPLISLQVDADGTFIQGKVHSIKLIGRGIPALDEKHQAFEKIKTLTKTDFPKNKIVFDELSHEFYLKE